MYIVKVLVEHPVARLDMTFDYLSDSYIVPGCRVKIRFGHQNIVGYVDSIEETMQTKEQLEDENGFTYLYIQDVIDEKPLLNKELEDLSLYLSKLTLSSRMACLQCMLPPQLKPASHHHVGIKYEKYVEFIKDIPLKTKKQQESLQYIQEHDQLPLKEYPFSYSIIQNIEKQKAIRIIEKEVYRDPYQLKAVRQEDYPLTSKQQKVVQQILSSYDRYETFLLHGVTGSGKTEVYLHLSRFVIAHQKTVLMLVPEISLTPMMVQAFKSRFGKEVAILHSKLSDGERYDEYRRIVAKEVKIVVGARSAVFAPL